MRSHVTSLKLQYALYSHKVYLSQIKKIFLDAQYLFYTVKGINLQDTCQIELKLVLFYSYGQFVRIMHYYWSVHFTE